MEGIHNLKQKVRRLEQLINMLEAIIQSFGDVNLSSGAPGDATSGRFYWDLTGKNLYFNEGTNTAPVWILVS